MIKYIKDRLNETSTYLILLTGIVAGINLPLQEGALVIGLHVLAAFVPDKTLANDILKLKEKIK